MVSQNKTDSTVVNIGIETKMHTNSIEEIIADIRDGKMVIIMDDEDRENEGDLIIAASKIRAEDINFMATYGRGLICLTLTKDRCKQLQLPLMVSKANDSHGTSFTVSIEAAQGVTTGISAADRAVTVQAAVAADAKPSDIVQPGHIFPLMARPGGTLTRAGHTEAGCDLARLAKLEPASVIVEILNEDGTMARRADLEKFAAQHDVKIGTIASLIQYRLENEKTINRVADCDLSNEYGDFELITYQDDIDSQLHYALKMGDVSADEATLVRVHMSDFVADVLHTRRHDCGWPLQKAMSRIAKEGKGIIIILGMPENNENIVKRMKNYNSQDSGAELTASDGGFDIRTYGIGAQILADLGVQKMKVLSAPKKFHGLSGFGLEVTEYVACD